MVAVRDVSFMDESKCSEHVWSRNPPFSGMSNDQRDALNFPYEPCLVFMGFCRLVTNYMNFAHEEWCRFAAVFILGWDIIEFIWGLDWPGTNVQVGEKIFESNGSTVFLPLSFAKHNRSAKFMRHMTKGRPDSVLIYAGMMLL